MKQYEIYLKERGTIGGWYIWVDIDEKTPVEFRKQVLQGRFSKLLKRLEEDESRDTESTK